MGEDLVKLSSKDMEALRGNPNDLIRVRHNGTPEVIDGIIKGGVIKKSSDGTNKVYVEAIDAPVENGVVKQNPDIKADQLGIDPSKANAGVDFYVRRGDLKLENNTVTGGKDLTIEGDVFLQGRSPESFVRKNNG